MLAAGLLVSSSRKAALNAPNLISLARVLVVPFIISLIISGELKLAFVLVLLAGLLNMMRGTSPNLSQKLMRWRIGLQFAAILVIIAFVLYQRA